MFPELTEWKYIIDRTKDFVDEFWFENLNVRAANWSKIKSWLREKHPELLKLFQEIYFEKSNYWNKIEREIESFCKEKRIIYSRYFHHEKK
jgi:hypothetical protein